MPFAWASGAWGLQRFLEALSTHGIGSFIGPKRGTPGPSNYYGGTLRKGRFHKMKHPQAQRFILATSRYAFYLKPML